MRCRHCGTAIGVRVGDTVWVDLGGSPYCAPSGPGHTPEDPEPELRQCGDCGRTLVEYGGPERPEPLPRGVTDAEDYARWRATNSGTEADYLAERGGASRHLCDDECGDPTHPRDGREVPEPEPMDVHDALALVLDAATAFASVAPEHPGTYAAKILAAVERLTSDVALVDTRECER